MNAAEEDFEESVDSSNTRVDDIRGKVLTLSDPMCTSIIFSVNLLTFGTLDVCLS